MSPRPDPPRFPSKQPLLTEGFDHVTWGRTEETPPPAAGHAHTAPLRFPPTDEVRREKRSKFPFSLQVLNRLFFSGLLFQDLGPLGSGSSQTLDAASGRQEEPKRLTWRLKWEQEGRSICRSKGADLDPAPGGRWGRGEGGSSASWGGSTIRGVSVIRAGDQTAPCSVWG